MNSDWRMRILVVEDNPRMAQLLWRLLRKAGHEVELAADGETAVSAALANPPDVVLLDLKLPGIDGWEVARQVQEQPAVKKPLLVAVTGCDSAEDRRRSREAGIDIHLVKPVSPIRLNRLLSRFRRVIDISSVSVS
jgi:two-component system, OmpR family, response regulator